MPISPKNMNVCLVCGCKTDRATSVCLTQKQRHFAPDMEYDIDGRDGLAYFWLCEPCDMPFKAGEAIKDIRARKRMARAARLAF